MQISVHDKIFIKGMSKWPLSIPTFSGVINTADEPGLFQLQITENLSQNSLN